MAKKNGSDTGSDTGSESSPPAGRERQALTQFKPGNEGLPGTEEPPEPELDATLPLQLWAARVAGTWDYRKWPRNKTVRLYLALRKSDMKDFLSAWQRLEREYSQALEKAGLPAIQLPPPPPPPPPSSEPDPSERVADPTGERVVADMTAWLERHRLQALAEAEKLRRGEKPFDGSTGLSNPVAGRKNEGGGV